MSSSELPPGFIVKDGICYGSRMPGLLEIKYHDPKKKNAAGDGLLLMARLID